MAAPSTVPAGSCTCGRRPRPAIEVRVRVRSRNWSQLVLARHRGAARWCRRSGSAARRPARARGRGEPQTRARKSWSSPSGVAETDLASAKRSAISGPNLGLRDSIQAPCSAQISRGCRRRKRFSHSARPPSSVREVELRRDRQGGAALAIALAHRVGDRLIGDRERIARDVEAAERDARLDRAAAARRRRGRSVRASRGEPADGVEAARQRHDAGAVHRIVRRPDAEDAVEAGGDAHRAAGVAAQARGRRCRGRRRTPSRRTSRRARAPASRHCAACRNGSSGR